MAINGTSSVLFRSKSTFSVATWTWNTCAWPIRIHSHVSEPVLYPKAHSNLHDEDVFSCLSRLQEVRGCWLPSDRSRLGRLRCLDGSQWEGGVFLTSSEGVLLPARSTQSSDGKSEFVCVKAGWRSSNFRRGVKSVLRVCLYSCPSVSNTLLQGNKLHFFKPITETDCKLLNLLHLLPLYRLFWNIRAKSSLIVLQMDVLKTWMFL